MNRNMNLIRKKRKELKLTQQQLADQIGVALRTVQYWEDGRNVEDKYVPLLADFLKLSHSEVKGYAGETDEFLALMAKIDDPQLIADIKDLALKRILEKK